MSTNGSIISLRNISWRREGQTILQDIHWNVEPGEHWAILGANGCGKTTLLNIINGYIWPTTGEVAVLGHRFGHCDLRELRKSIGWVSSSLGERLFQSHPSETAIDVVLSGKFATIGIYDSITEEDEATAMDLLAQFGCAALTERPFQLLSQGEKQRVLLARAWMASPSILILDEPCTGLDVKSREEVLQAIQALGQVSNGPTLLYVTHHVEELMPVFSNVLLMQDGMVRAAGPKRNTLEESLVSDVLGVPVALTWDGDRPWLQVKTASTLSGLS